MNWSGTCIIDSILCSPTKRREAGSVRLVASVNCQSALAPLADTTMTEVTDEDIQHLREWISKTPYVPTHYDDHFLRSFVVACKGSLQKTKLVLDKFSSVVTKYPDMYGNLDMRRKAISDFLDIAICYPLPRKVNDDVIVYFYGISKRENDPYKFDILSYFPIEFASMLIRIKENQLGSGRLMMVIDGDGLVLTHMRGMTPTVIKAWLQVLDHLVPIRLFAIHTINMPTFMEWVFNLMKQLLKAKIAERIHMHSTLESFYKHVPREILPSNYGGLEDDCQLGHDKYRKKLEDSTEMLLKEQKLLVEADKLRPRTKDDEDTIGTFKQLTVD